MVTCHCAQRFPNVLATRHSKGEEDGDDDGSEAGRYPEGVYDRIVCDVPCSGDGTTRKHPEVSYP